MNMKKLGPIKKIIQAINQFEGIEKYASSHLAHPPHTEKSSAICSECSQSGMSGDQINGKNYSSQLKPEVVN